MNWKETAQDYSNICAQLGHINLDMDEIIFEYKKEDNSEEKYEELALTYQSLVKTKQELIERASVLRKALKDRV